MENLIWKILYYVNKFHLIVKSINKWVKYKFNVKVNLINFTHLE